jgi:hypothetical protein
VDESRATVLLFPLLVLVAFAGAVLAMALAFAAR